MRKSIKRILACVSICAAVLSAQLSYCADSETAEKVRVGFYILPGYCERKPDGRLFGVNVELAEMLAASNGWQMVRVPLKWSEIQQELAAGKIDVAPGVTRLGEADGASAWTNDCLSQETGSLHLYLFTKKDVGAGCGADVWSQWSIGTVNRELAQEVMRVGNGDENFHVRLKSFSTTSELALSLRNWACDGAISPSLPEMNGARVAVDFGCFPLYVATSKARPELKAQIDRTLASVLSNDPAYFTRRLEACFPPPETPCANLPAPRAEPSAEVSPDETPSVEESSGERSLASSRKMSLPGIAVQMTIAALVVAALVLTLMSQRRLRGEVRSALGRSARSQEEADAAMRETRRIVDLGESIRQGMEVMLRVADPEQAMPGLCERIGEMMEVDGVVIRFGPDEKRVREWTWRRTGASVAWAGAAPHFNLPLTVDGAVWGEVLGFSSESSKPDVAANRYLGMLVRAIESFLRMAEIDREFKANHLELERNARRLVEVAEQQKKLRGMLETLADQDDPMANVRQVMGEAAQLFGSDCCVIVRYIPGGGLDRPYTWVRPEMASAFPKQIVAHEFVVSAILEENPVLIYPRKTSIGEFPDLDALIDKYGAYALVAGALNVRGRRWGHVLFVSHNDAVESEDVRDLLLELVRVLEIAIRRRMLLDEIAFKQCGLEQALTAAEKAASARAQFLTSVSHEIRTPLNAVIGFTEKLEGHAADAARTCTAHSKVLECAREIRQSAKVLLDLLEDVFDLSQLELGASDLRRGRCDLAAMMREIADVYGTEASLKGVKMKVRVSPNFPCVRLSEQSVRQILLNLIGNAVKFTSKGEIQVAAVCARTKNGLVDVRLMVRDTGCGIPPERLESVFVPFERDIARDGDVSHGVGCGLAIVKRLVDAAGAKISLESHPGVGTVASVDVDGLELATDETAQDVAVATDDFSDVEVLAVDDVPLNLTVMSVHLRKAGVKCIRCARDGREALKAVREQRPDLVITDIWMPEMSGVAMAEAVRADPALSSLWITAATADLEVSRSFDTHNFDDVVSKPMTGGKIMGMLRKWQMNRKRGSRT